MEKFSSYPEAFRKEGGKNYMNLKLVAQKKLEQCGVRQGNITVSTECTYCQPEKYYSFRKDRSEPLQAMIVVAGMKTAN